RGLGGRTRRWRRGGFCKRSRRGLGGRHFRRSDLTVLGLVGGQLTSQPLHLRRAGTTVTAVGGRPVPGTQLGEEVIALPAGLRLVELGLALAEALLGLTCERRTLLPYLVEKSHRPLLGNSPGPIDPACARSYRLVS